MMRDRVITRFGERVNKCALFPLKNNVIKIWQKFSLGNILVTFSRKHLVALFSAASTDFDLNVHSTPPLGKNSKNLKKIFSNF
jgi:hypothetical protein